MPDPSQIVGAVLSVLFACGVFTGFLHGERRRRRNGKSF